MSKVIEMHPARNPDNVLREAMGDYEDVLVLGYNTEGYLSPRASMGLTKAQMLLLVEQFKLALVDGRYDEKEE